MNGADPTRRPQGARLPAVCRSVTEGFCVNCKPSLPLPTIHLAGDASRRPHAVRHGRGQVCLRAECVEVQRSCHGPQLAVELCTGPGGNDIRLGPDSSGPKNWDISDTQRELVNDASSHDTPMRSSFTFVRKAVLQNIRIPFDLAGIIILHYEAHEVTR
jgi:hypothetical protein